MKKILIVFSVLFLQVAAFSQTKWTLDRTHSNVRFTVPHLVISEVEGSFRKFDGTVSNNNPDFTDASINFTIDVASINTDNDRRDGHLKSDDFFNAEKYPQMTFQSTSIKKLKGNKYELTGNLTIRDVTKPVKFDVVYGGTAKDGRGITKSGFKATSIINRFDYGLKWNSLTEAGGVTVGQDITIDLKLEFEQAKS
jgi:polyisoprenoid-binding protein YceI